ncbi:MAG: Gfo/Idh/MocA family oxidoreductase [Candidatus Sumerlaeia bacterium]|nr:Gfo/Idh/MocA family oxidoreductase [Candidatus Sumerlaeia bacterium]
MVCLRIGIIGFGSIGKVHAYAYRNMALYYDPPPIETRLAGVCTSRPETAEAAQRAVGFDFATTDWRAITENANIDAVHICTPNSLHVEPVLSALAHGKHVYCEKPLAANVDEARRIAAALDGYRGVHQMTFNYRFLPATLRAKHLVDAGFLGRPLCFRAAYLHSGSADPNAPLKWKLSGAMGGGVIQDLGSHVLDLLRHFLGEPVEIGCSTMIAFAQRPAFAHAHSTPVASLVKVDAEDHAVMLVRTASGALGTIEASKIAAGIEDELRVEIHGTRGALRFNLMDPNWVEVFDAAAPDQPFGGERGWKRIASVHRYPAPGGWPGVKFPVGWMRSHVACVHNFLSAIAAGAKAEPGLEVGVRVQELIAAALESDRARCWVKV